ncbi:MAG: TRIC cation channel family protein [Gemmatimonadaceae bacterium]|nr:TRIC cation channel family protein [Gemmatimonadaceae bacterium]
MPYTLALEVVAVVLAALSAMITAAKKNLDLVGTYSLAVIVAFGGGTIRDLLLMRRPFFWAQRWEYLVVIFVLSLPFVYSRRMHQLSQRLVARGELVDALGLGFYTVVGCMFALEAKQPAVVAILLGIITATGGGIIGDVLTNEIPGYFLHGPLYTSSAFVGAVAFVALEPVSHKIAVPAAVGSAVVLRLMSVFLGATLPRPHWLRTDAYPIQGPPPDGPRPPG